ncbi:MULTISPECIES: polysaccharide deacetylase family protein [Microbacterium]|uniref:polysaccharide deacetylase family protein n=1 Tax=Microbacterium TaxID=33882 RepID=UPI00103A5598|nr:MULTISPECIES: polysaccharide deacetylase family protein [Microbacterium]MCE0509963.1 polysaccharide deacetylase family protein [Microbacterium sp. KKR3/1]MCZ4301954.1 polysaccharide deacetylase family protein [Microbacterium oxydans]QEA27457.1 ChbG/HpnK family deacetylase [Microbacterium sp. CBA3102]TCJ21069.1 ChbG/HpnK family deacetylase [Microbacterium sp. PI-1]TFB16058.1 ChbG/HpnK family deacetylase [Microbacterium sp. 3H14]
MTLPSDLADRLGLAPGARAIILNADDFGMCHAANTAIVDLLDAGRIDSATVMVPCSWSPEALAFAASRPDLDIGVHLVLTSEWSRYRWRPLTGTDTSLVDAAGFFPMDVASVEQAASEEDVAVELAAQLQAALDAGVDVTHLDNHMGSVYGLVTGRDFLRPVFELAARHGLPFRLPRSMDGVGEDAALQATLDAAAAAADASGVVIIDRLWSHPFPLLGEGTPEEETYEQVRDGFIALLRAVPAGVTEIYLHPMVDDEELRSAVDFSATKRGYELRLLRDPAVLQAIEDEALVRVGWRALRDVQRAGVR